MSKKHKNETIDYRPAIVEELPDMARIFWWHIKADPAYISHGEIQTGVALGVNTTAPDGKDKWCELIAALFDDRNCRIYVAQRDDEIVGFSVVTAADDGDRPFGMLNHLIVSPKYRRRGIGRELLSRSLAWLRKRRIADCWLESGRENHAAHDFFYKHDFAQVSHTFHLCLTSKQP